MSKSVRYDNRAVKEIRKFPSEVQAKIQAGIILLARDGQLQEPLAKKIDTCLFELRIKYKGQWRVIYAYLIEDYVIVLSAFHKKTQKTPLLEIKKATQRLKGYI